MNPLLDGFSALGHHAWAAFGVLAMMIWGCAAVGRILKIVFTDSLSGADYLSLSLAGWVLPAALWAGIYASVVFQFGTMAGRIVAILIIVGSLFVVFKDAKRVSAPALALSLLFLVFLLLRFAFLKKAVMPPYFDSAEHYRIVQFLSETWFAGVAPSAPSAETYYHTGYHWLAAALSHFFQIRISELMLVFGQALLAVLPLPLFFIVKRASGSNAAGLFSVLLAGTGWHMPSHAVNWGKYPALLSLIGVHFVLALGCAPVRRQCKRQQILFYALTGAGVLLSAFIHTRSLLVYAGTLAAVVMAMFWRRFPPTVQRICFGFLVIALAIEIGWARASPALAPLLTAYVREDARMLLLAAALLPFAAAYYASHTFFIAASLVFIMLALFVPVRLPGLGILTLLDRPFVQALAYLPLSIAGGLGFAGASQWIKRLVPRANLPARLTILSLFGLVLVNAGFNQKFYPSECCQFVSRDDLAALTWINASLPAKANILIASESLYVTSFEQDTARAGADGGIWISPLTTRQTVLAWRALDFTQPETHAELCSRSVDYVYAGGMPHSFDRRQFAVRAEWYQPVFSLPAAGVYRVKRCR